MTIVITSNMSMFVFQDGTETMSEGEVVHCTCTHTEGDGMMVQCESCLTWQHGGCLGIDSADQVHQHC